MDGRRSARIGLIQALALLYIYLYSNSDLLSRLTASDTSNANLVLRNMLTAYRLHLSQVSFKMMEAQDCCAALATRHGDIDRNARRTWHLRGSPASARD